METESLCLGMTYEQAKAIRDSLERDVEYMSAKLKTYPKNADGLTPDKVKGPKWRKDCHAYAYAFRRLQDFNSGFVKTFAAEIRAERAARHAVTP